MRPANNAATLYDDRVAAPLRRFEADILRYPQIRNQAQFDHLFAAYQRLGGQETYNCLLYGMFYWIQYVMRGIPALGVSRHDRIQEGFIGVMKGIETYDPSRGLLFTTYFYWKIYGELMRLLQNNQRFQVFQISVGRLHILNLIRREGKSFAKEHHRSASDEELLEWIHRFDNTENATKIASRITADDILGSHVYEGMHALHLDQILPSHGDESCRETFGDIVGAEVDPVNGVFVDELLEAYHGVLDRFDSYLQELVENQTFTQRDVAIVRHRYGVGVRKVLTLQQLAEHFKTSRERIRQLEERAMNSIELGIALTASQLQAVVHGVAILTELSENEVSSRVAGNIPTTILPSAVTEITPDVRELLPTLRHVVAHPHYFDLRDPVLCTPKHGGPERCVLATIARYFKLRHHKIRFPDMRKRRERRAHLLYIYFLHHTCGWSTRRISHETGSSAGHLLPQMMRARLYHAELNAYLELFEETFRNIVKITPLENGACSLP